MVMPSERLVGRLLHGVRLPSVYAARCEAAPAAARGNGRSRSATISAVRVGGETCVPNLRKEKDTESIRPGLGIEQHAPGLVSRASPVRAAGHQPML